MGPTPCGLARRHQQASEPLSEMVPSRFFVVPLIGFCCQLCSAYTPGVAFASSPSTPLLSNRRVLDVHMDSSWRRTYNGKPADAVVTSATRPETYISFEIFSCFPGCPDSKKTKDFLDGRGVAYTEFDCSASEHDECPLSDMSIFVVRTSLSSMSFRCSDILAQGTNKLLRDRLSLVF